MHVDTPGDLQILVTWVFHEKKRNSKAGERPYYIVLNQPNLSTDEYLYATLQFTYISHI